MRKYTSGEMYAHEQMQEAKKFKKRLEKDIEERLKLSDIKCFWQDDDGNCHCESEKKRKGYCAMNYEPGDNFPTNICFAFEDAYGLCNRCGGIAPSDRICNSKCGYREITVKDFSELKLKGLSEYNDFHSKIKISIIEDFISTEECKGSCYSCCLEEVCGNENFSEEEIKNVVSSLNKSGATLSKYILFTEIRDKGSCHKNKILNCEECVMKGGCDSYFSEHPIKRMEEVEEYFYSLVSTKTF